MNTNQIVQVAGLRNQGTLNIANVAELNISGSLATSLLNNGHVKVNGSLIITNAGLHGYRGLSNSLFSNYGIVEIANSGGDAILLSNSTIDNRSVGQMTLTNSSGENILLTNGSIFYQKGILTSN